MKARPLLKKFIEEEWTFEEFAFSNEIRNIYSMFLWNFPVERFGFIGITEFFDEDLQYFAKNYLELTDVTVPEMNQNKKKRGKKITDKGLIREIREYHSEDYKLYNYALNLRSKR